MINWYHEILIRNQTWEKIVFVWRPHYVYFEIQHGQYFFLAGWNFKNLFLRCKMYYGIVTWMFFIWLERCWIVTYIYVLYLTGMLLDGLLEQPGKPHVAFYTLWPKVGSILYYLGLFIAPHLGYMLFCLTPLTVSR